MSHDWKQLEAVEPQSPPPILGEQIRARVLHDIQPGTARVAAKVLGLHVIAGGVSLVLCPQFGVGPFGGDAGLMGFLMQWGWVACALGCGAAFMMGTGALSTLFLSPDEKRVLSRHSAWVFTSVSAASWGAFMLFGGRVHESALGSFEHLSHDSMAMAPNPLAWGALWALAAAFSAFTAFRLGVSRSAQHHAEPS